MRVAGPALALALAAAALPAAAELAIPVAWIERREAPAPVLSNMPEPPADLGLAGARLAIADNATTGRFLKQAWSLSETVVAEGEDFAAAAAALLAGGARLLVVKAPEADLLALADLPAARDALLLNAGAEDPRLRGPDCRANLLHTALSRDMRADALMQFLVRKRWTDLALLHGTAPADLALAEAFRRSAAKFGLRIRAEKRFDSDADLRRLAGQELPLLLQDLPDHHVLLVADAAGDFAPLVPYNTWAPRPVAGSEGLVPVAWDPVIEAWGAAQLQNRFEALAGRGMLSADWAAWAAVRALGEAATRTGSAEAAALRAYMLSPAFALAAHKGNRLTFRPWNGQLRQPVALVQPRALVATAPVEGFLHRVTELDTLGLDEPESGCNAFRN